MECRKCKSVLEVTGGAEGSEFACPVCRERVKVPSERIPYGPVPPSAGGAASGPEPPHGFSLREFFSEVFAGHPDEEVENSFMVGTSKTTPDIFETALRWPKPWLFARLLVSGIAIYYIWSSLWEFWAGKDAYDIIAIPDILLVGSFAVPLASVVLFFEMNARRNVSLYQIVRLVFAGGFLSLVLTDFFNLSRPWILETFGVSEEWHAALAGPIEEAAKLSAVLLMVRGTKYRYTLNGMLFGAAVGAGFAMFESAGYAFRAFISSFAVDLGNSTLALAKSGTLTDEVFHGKVLLESLNPAMEKLNEVIVLRGLLAPIGHVAYSAIAAGALWRVKGERTFSWSMLAEMRFLDLFAVAVALHAFWNSPLFPSDGLPWVKIGVAGIVGWGFIFSMIHDGLRQIRKEQDAIVGPE